MAERNARSLEAWADRLADLLTLIIILGLAIFAEAVLNAAFGPRSPAEWLNGIQTILTIYAIASVIGLERRLRRFEKEHGGPPHG